MCLVPAGVVVARWLSGCSDARGAQNKVTSPAGAAGSPVAMNASTPVFPGWYTGRAIHLHFTVRIGGQEYTTSQLYFEDALSDEIESQGIYKARGKRDTTNASDFIFSSGGGTPDQVLMSTAKRPDGVLHAWKVLSIT